MTLQPRRRVRQRVKIMRTRLGTRRNNASSRSQGRFVAAINKILSSRLVPAPSSCTRNSVFIRLELSWSPSPRAESNESTSSRKMTLGWRSRAILKSARTIFSDSPTYFEVRDAADAAKKLLALDSVATALARKVLPVPGGPKNKTPRGGARSPR